uniref:Transcription factor bHLH130 n=1 Tax=Aegilops tauschii TaxID=37682 RepID=M8BGD0_AEGTA
MAGAAGGGGYRNGDARLKGQLSFSSRQGSVMSQISEMVRRTKISERIRKLQELVPNMEKQTNTSDMLDLAVDYIKELQMQVKVMNDGRASCTCAAGRAPRNFAS